jgi:hypothetical protein
MPEGANMSKENEKKEAPKSQLSWRMTGRELYCDIPGIAENVSIDIDTTHESWNDFLKVYGIKQWISSANAKNSFKLPDSLKIDIIQAQHALANAVTDEDKKAAQELLSAFEKQRADLRLGDVKAKSGEIKTMVFNMMKMLKSEKTVVERAERESKAAVEARVRAEEKAAMRTKMEALGFTAEQIETLLS